MTTLNVYSYTNHTCHVMYYIGTQTERYSYFFDTKEEAQQRLNDNTFILLIKTVPVPQTTKV